MTEPKAQRKKGLSHDEKKVALLEMFHNTLVFYTLKEVEKVAPSVGVVSQSVKEVLEALVAEDLVIQDKVGAQQLFWSLKSRKKGELTAESEMLKSGIRDAMVNLQQHKEDLAYIEQQVNTTPEAAAQMEKDYIAEHEKNLQLKPVFEELQKNHPRIVLEKKQKLDQMKDEFDEICHQIITIRRKICQGDRKQQEHFDEKFEIDESCFE